MFLLSKSREFLIRNPQRMGKIGIVDVSDYDIGYGYWRRSARG